jgi:hypothetical protein
MNVTTLDNVLWAAGFIGHVALLFVLVLRARWRTFPIFSSMIAYQAMVTIVLFLIYRYGTHHGYSVAYWTAAIGDFGFQIAIIFEIARQVLRPTGTWVTDARKSFLLWSGLGVLVAAGISLSAKPAASSTLSILEVRSILFTSFLTCEVFLAMIMAANRLGLRWRSHVMALAQGLTAWALVALASSAAHIALGWNRDFVVLDHIRMFCYLGALVFWMVMFWLRERERAPLSPEMSEYLLALHHRVTYDLERLTATKKPSI